MMRGLREGIVDFLLRVWDDTEGIHFLFPVLAIVGFYVGAMTAILTR